MIALAAAAALAACQPAAEDAPDGGDVEPAAAAAGEVSQQPASSPDPAVDPAATDDAQINPGPVVGDPPPTLPTEPTSPPAL